MSRHVVGAKLQRELPWVFRLNPTAPEIPVWSDLWVDNGWVKLCESSSPTALKWEVEQELQARRYRG